jgi:curved DNA-binding protein CbpA
MSQTAPNVSGTLAATPVGHLLIHALDRRLTGSMVFEEPSHQKHAVYFASGAALVARTAGVVAPLGALAVARGLIAEERLGAALRAAEESGKRLGRILLDWMVTDEASLETLLREQVSQRVKALQRLPAETAYGFYEGRNFLERAGGPTGPCAPLPLIWRVMRVGSDQGRAAEGIARLQGLPLRFHVDAPLARFEFEPAEQAAVDVLRAKAQPYEELRARDLLDPALLERLVFTLLLLRQFDTGTGAVPIGAERRSLSPRAAHSSPSIATGATSVTSSSPAASSGPVASSSPMASPSPTASPGPAPPTASPVAARPAPQGGSPSADDALRREAAERAQATRQSYYEVLGVQPDAPPPAIAAAYFQLAKRWHPDRLDEEHADLRDVAIRIFARIGEANQVLSDPDQRRQYDELLKTGDGDAEEQEQVQKVLRAATSFQKAQVLLRRNNLAGAEEAARAALADAPEEADHIALVAWLESLKPNANLEARLRDLARAVKLDETNVRVRWFRGQLLKRLGKLKPAMEDFRYIVEKDPRHVDAQREVRLYEMQRGKRPHSDSPPGDRRSDPLVPRDPSTPPPGDRGGFFGKLFKK